ncbi:hypothetical protein jhhlp_002624 [Lomentospora prolificans]|uniref:rhomboid protease n=1 Tax=Lomentospora prolificans TaxID=41688 RepID=A0A2N3NEP9_9PEZI|nr:hypothetical protein jhhlp_002624 [Lomentospora prolificans]
MPPSFMSAMLRSALPASVLRLPLLTRCSIILVAICSLLSFQTRWDVQQWAFLVPSKVSLTSAYRTNTYAFVHTGITHALYNLVILTPLMSRFEVEHGTLTSLALFSGPFSTFPAFLYVLIDRFLIHTDAVLAGASTWVFLLLSLELAQTRKTRPSVIVGSFRVPTWTALLVAIILKEICLPSSSLLGPLCGAVIGYACGRGVLGWLAPPERLLRWLEAKLTLLRRLPHYISMDQNGQGRYGTLPTSSSFSLQPQLSGSQ